MTEPQDADADPGRLGAVVLAGGTAARMDGADKAAIELRGVTLLERALAATLGAVEVVVVGDPVPTTRPVTFTVEDPRRGGPAAGLLAGLGRFYRPPDLVMVLAVDMPRVGPGTFARLTEALLADPASTAALLVGAGGRRQPLCAVYRHAALQRRPPGAARGRARAAGPPPRRRAATVEVPEVAAEARDVDTWADLRELREES